MLRRFLTPLSFLFCLATFNVQAENTTFTTQHFSGSGICADCHDNLSDSSGDDVSIVQDWSASMMANAAKDPFWQAKVAAELARNPQLEEVINDKCTECHAPMANYEITQSQGRAVELFGANGILNADHPLHDAAMNGVSCTLCHQISDDATLGSLAGFSGQYKINGNKIIYGQYSDIFSQLMQNNTGYTPDYSAHISESAMCATCHNLKTPYVDANGNVLTTSPEAEFPEQMPYTEWENSIFADDGSNPASCQDCHMPKTTAKVANRPNWLKPKQGFAKHHMVGANTVMLTMLRDNAEQLDVNSQNMDLGIERARTMLQQTADLEILDAEVIDGELKVHVKLTNNSGHKAPTAYPSRRLWLHFQVTDSAGNLLFESGRMNPDGSIEGADSDQDPSIFEPHYDRISAADQVQIYETIMGDSDGNSTYTLLRGARYLKDNRLTPQGFDKQRVPADVAVAGLATGDENFNLGSDEIVYQIPISAAGELHVSVSLNYQPLAHAFVQDLYQEALVPEVQSFLTLYEAQSLKHELVTRAQTTVISDGGSQPPLPLPSVSLASSAVSIELGQSATLTWSSDNASACIASGAWTGNKAISGSETVNPTQTSVYSLTCSNAQGSASDSQTIQVSEPAPISIEPTMTLTASPASVNRGDSITLTWSSSDASSCTASGDWSGGKPLSGSESIVISDPVTFTLSCSGEGGSVTDAVTYQARGRRWLSLQ